MKVLSTRVRRARHERKRRKALKDERRYYTKLKEVFAFPNNINLRQCFWLEKDLIRGGEFKDWVNPAKRIFPVICEYWNKENRITYPKEIHIAQKAGVSLQTVKKGIDALLEYRPYKFRIASREEMGFVNSNGYYMDLPISKDHDAKYGYIAKDGKYFPVHHWVIKSGIYSRLSGNAQSLWLSLRAHAYFDLKEYLIYEEDIVINHESEFWSKRYYQKRKYDFLKFTGGRNKKKQIAIDAGIHPANFADAFRELKSAGLVEKIETGYYKIFLRAKDNMRVDRAALLMEVYEKFVIKGRIS
jgi:hypothetical protein